MFNKRSGIKKDKGKNSFTKEGVAYPIVLFISWIFLNVNTYYFGINRFRPSFPKPTIQNHLYRNPFFPKPYTENPVLTNTQFAEKIII